jgi:Calx-beta domain
MALAGLSQQFATRLLFALFLVVFPVAPLVTVQPPASSSKEDKKSKPESKTDLGKLKVSELIDMLQEESKEDSTAWASGFLATEEQSQFLRLFPGSRKPNTAASGTLTFAPGETTKTITIEVKGDSKKEANETFYLDLSGNSGNSLFTKNRGIGTILNDD